MSPAPESGTPTPGLDRAAAVRAAVRRLVGERGFHGATMGAVAREAGVAAGTPYVHYRSKDELVLAAYLETKQDLGAAAACGLDPDADPGEQFGTIWLGVYRHLVAEPDRARFLLQVDASPYGRQAHSEAMSRDDDALMALAASSRIADRLVPLPIEVLYELGLAPAVRLAAAGLEPEEAELELIAARCWRAISQD